MLVGRVAKIPQYATETEGRQLAGGPSVLPINTPQQL
jgi:hypothetical protein